MLVFVKVLVQTEELVIQEVSGSLDDSTLLFKLAQLLLKPVILTEQVLALALARRDLPLHLLIIH